MRTRKSSLARLNDKLLSYIDLFVRTICIVLGLLVSGWVKFVDGDSPATSAVSTPAIQGSTHSNTALSLVPLPHFSGTANQHGYSMPDYFRR